MIQKILPNISRFLLLSICFVASACDTASRLTLRLDYAGTRVHQDQQESLRVVESLLTRKNYTLKETKEDWWKDFYGDQVEGAMYAQPDDTYEHRDIDIISSTDVNFTLVVFNSFNGCLPEGHLSLAVAIRERFPSHVMEYMEPRACHEFDQVLHGKIREYYQKDFINN